MVFTSRQNL